MCDKIKKIKNKTPKEILDEYWDEHFPVNSKMLLNKMGIKTEKIDFTPLEASLYLEGNDHICGLAYSQNDDLNILYSDKLNDIVVNYVLAHELAHCCIHLPVYAEFHVELKTEKDLYFPYPRTKRKTKKKELEADIFATNLLIPNKKFIETIEQSVLEGSVPTINSLSNTFKVPEEIIRLKISIINRQNKLRGIKKYVNNSAI